MSDSDEQRKARISALLEERRGYEIHGKKERVAEVDAQLRLLGAEGAPKAKRAAKRAKAKE